MVGGKEDVGIMDGRTKIVAFQEFRPRWSLIVARKNYLQALVSDHCDHTVIVQVGSPTGSGYEVSNIDAAIITGYKRVGLHGYGFNIAVVNFQEFLNYHSVSISIASPNLILGEVSRVPKYSWGEGFEVQDIVQMIPVGGE